MPAHSGRSRHRLKTRRMPKWLASALTLSLAFGSLVVMLGQGELAQSQPQPQLTVSAPAELAGVDAQIQVSVANRTHIPDPGEAVDWFNIAVTVLVPDGVRLQDSARFGSPVVYEAGETLPNSAVSDPALLNTVPVGYTLWLFNDISDLPIGGVYDGTLTVRADAELFPVGSEIPLLVETHTSTDPALQPMFDGSLGEGGQPALAVTASESRSEVLPIRSLRLSKAEASAESELLRGLHNPTEYTITIEHTGQGPHEQVEVVDYLPAGLEFLGCGASTGDNTRDSALLSDGSREYPGAPAINAGAAAPVDCVEPVSVTTVLLEAGNEQLLPAGVYTQVRWSLEDLIGGTQQSYPDEAGHSGTVRLRYFAAVPLFENTMDFVDDDGAGAPSPESLGQAANINNNNGPSTRHGLDQDRFDDGQALTNTAAVIADYTGDLAEGAAVGRSARGAVTVTAMDARLLKSSDRSQFATGELITYTLTVETGEYTSTRDLVFTDVLPDGLCPVVWLGPGATSTGDALPADCAAAMLSEAVDYPGAEIENLHFDQGNGTFTITFRVDESIATQSSYALSYTALMRADYQARGHTSSGDSLSNTVSMEAVTDSRPELAGIASLAGDAADGEQTIWDDSQASIASDFSVISKEVLERSAVGDAAQPCEVAGPWYDGVDTIAGGFVPGDVVCYRLTVRFADEISVRNPKVTDNLPSTVSYLGWALGEANTVPAEMVGSPAVTGKRVAFTLGEEGVDGDRFVPIGTTLSLLIWGVVDSAPAQDRKVDKPENLMKFQQQNVEGELFFLRDAAAIDVNYGMALIKGVEEVDGESARDARHEQLPDGTAFASDRDGIQVMAGEEVRYRIDIPAVGYEVVGMQIVDVLPETIAAADVSDISDGGLSYDSEHPDYPMVNAPYAGRSVIVWNVAPQLAVNTELGYTVTVPDDVLVNTELENVAAITEYRPRTNLDGVSVLRPEPVLDQPLVTLPGEGRVVKGFGFQDVSSVYTPRPTVTKTVLSSEVQPGATVSDTTQNRLNDVVLGELVSYQYQVTIPALTSVADAVLRDRGTFTLNTRAYAVHSTSVQYPDELLDPEALGFVFCGVAEDEDDEGDAGDEDAPDACEDLAAGTLLFPEFYSNDTEQEQRFTVTLTVWVPQRAANPVIPNHNANLVNQAQFRSDSYDGNATATVRFRAPAPSLAKSATPNTAVAGGDTITYTLTASQGNNRPALYDVVVLDCVPAELLNVRSLTPSVGTAVILEDDCGEGGTLIQWQFDRLNAGTAAARTLTYQADLSPKAAAGASYRNTAGLTGYTLPASIDGEPTVERRGTLTSTANADIDVIEPVLEKTVAPASGPVGAEVSYTVKATLKAEVSHFDLVLSDLLPTGIVLNGVPVLECLTAGDDPCAPALVPGYTQSGAQLAWDFGDVASHAEDRILTIVYPARITDAAAADSLVNTAQLRWNVIDDDPESQRELEDEATVTVLHPALTIGKSVSDSTVQPGQVVDFELTVTNRGTSPAHHIEVSDLVPDGLVVDPDSISHGGVLSGAGADGGGTITWSAAALPGPLSHESGSNTLVLSYRAGLAASEHLDGSELVNTAVVDGYESYPDGGREYGPSDPAEAEVTPIFPHLVPQKSTTGADIAYADASFGWTLTIRNTGDGDARDVVITDLLPKHWSFDAGSAVVSRDGTTLPDAAVPAISGSPTAAGEQLVWTLNGTAEAPALRAGGTIAVAFTATPSELALVDAGITTGAGVRVPHTNTVSVTGTDTSGADRNEDGPYWDPEDTAQAFIHSADLTIAKTAVGELLAGGQGVNGATGWTIVVSNLGPDPAVGPFSVQDVVETLPEGFEVLRAEGTGWICAPVGSGPGQDAVIDCVRSTADETLDAEASLPAIAVIVRTDAALASGTTVSNRAEVFPGRTVDPDPTNNDDEETLTVTSAADLWVDKSIVGTPRAGQSVSWTLEVGNLGPSVSQPDITVSDTVPGTVSGIVITADPVSWDCELTGNTVDCEYLANGGVMPVGQAPPITISGTLDASATGNLVNTAVVTPGPTPDPDPENNDSTTTTPIDEATTISASKRAIDPDSGDPLEEFVPGEPISYEIVVTNTGQATARGITVLDTVPEGLSYLSAAGQGGSVWSCTPGTGVVNCALTGTLAPGASAVLRIVFDTADTITADVVNTITADGDNTPPVTVQSTDPSDPVSDLAIAKSHTIPAADAAAVAGETVRYRLQVRNLGPSAHPAGSGQIEVSDTVPAGLSVLSAGGTGWDCQIGTAGPGGTVVDCVRTDDDEILLAETDLPDLIIQARVDADHPVASGVLNTATVRGTLPDPVPGNNDDTDPIDITTRAVMTIEKEVVGTGPFIAGETVDYTLTIVNEGPSVARGVRVDDLLPAELTLVSISGSTGWNCDVDTAACLRDEHPVGSSTITLTALIDAGVERDADIPNTAELRWTDAGGPGFDDDDEEITVATSADISLVKTAVDQDGDPTSTVVSGSTLRYTLQVHNAGPSVALAPFTIEDLLPEGMRYLSVISGAGWECSAVEDATTGRELVLCDFGEDGDRLAVGAGLPTLTIQVLLDDENRDSEILNTAVVSSPTPDPEPEDNTSTSPVEPEQLVDLEVVKSHTGTVRIDAELRFTVEVTNHGPSSATGVRASDTIPEGLEYLRHSSASDLWECTPIVDGDGRTTLECDYPEELGAGASAEPLFIDVLVTVEAYPGVTNTVTVSAEEPETELENNTSEDPVTVPPLSELSLLKEIAGDFTQGQRGSYRFTVSNTGPTEDPGPVVVSDDLPAGLRFVSGGGDVAECSPHGSLVECTLLAALPAGGSVTFEIKVDVSWNAALEITNLAVVDTPTEQEPDGEPESSVTHPVEEGKILSLTGSELTVQLAVFGAVLLGLGLLERTVWGRRRRED